MKIGIILPGGVARHGDYGVIPSVVALLERLGRSHDVHVFALSQEPRPSRYELEGIVVHNIGVGATRVRALGAVIAEHRLGRFDVFHAFWAASSGAVAAVAGQLLRRPVLLHLGGGELIAFPDIGYGGRLTVRGRALVRAALAGATRITAASSPVREEAARLGYESEHLTLGVSLERWPVRPPGRRAAGPARLLHVASLNRVKDQVTLLRAARSLRDRGVPFHLDVAGEDTLASEMQRTAAELGVASAVTFHGFLSREPLRGLADRADLLVLSSRHEAGPVVLLEAAIAGVPTVGTDVGQIHDWAPDAAVAVPVGNHEALAQGVSVLLENEDQRLRIATEAQRRAVAEDAEWTARRVQVMYEELGNGRETDQ